MKWLRYIFLICTIIVALFPVTPMYQSGILIMVWGISAIVNSFFRKRGTWGSELKSFLLFSGHFLFYLATAYAYDDSATTFKYLERKLSLIIIPLGFYLFYPALQMNFRRFVTMAFEYAGSILALYIAIDLAPFVFESWKQYHFANQFNFEFRTQVEQLVFMHPTYLSIILLFGVYLKVSRLLNTTRDNPSWIYLLETPQILISLTCCFLLSSRGPILSFFIALTVYLMYLNWKRTLIGVAFGIPVLLYFFLTVPAINERFLELKQVGSEYEESEELNSTTIRQAIYGCSMDALKEHWLTGVGLSRTQKMLNNCYEDLKDQSLRKMEYNTHNQYLEVWISGGLIALIIFLSMLFYGFRIAIVNNDKEYLGFLIIVCLCFLTENLLARQHGIVFFAFFNSLFGFRHSLSDKV